MFTNTSWRPISASSDINVRNPESTWQDFAAEGGLHRLLSNAVAASHPGAVLKGEGAPYGLTGSKREAGAA